MNSTIEQKADELLKKFGYRNLAIKCADEVIKVLPNNNYEQNLYINSWQKVIEKIKNNTSYPFQPS